MSIVVLLLLGGAGVALVRHPKGGEIVYVATAGLCGLIALAALAHLAGLGIGPDRLTLPVGLTGQASHLHLDALAGFFLVLINLSGATAALYGRSYGRHEPEPGRVVPLFPWFLAAMNVVVLAEDAFLFLVGWEGMSLVSWLLVLATHRAPGTLGAARIYLVMASFGTAALLLAFGLMAGDGGDYGFAALRAHAAALPPALGTLVFALVALGAGSKAGLAPLHVWLPLAHPAAPSHVSALMSGVMTKVAVYALVRILFDLVGQPAWWWGGVLMVAGAATAVLGVLYALMQDDLKRLLAYSTVENLGVITAGLGLALVFQAHNVPALAALALTAALLHAFNHSLFKSLLFYAAGAVLTATHRRDLDGLGGLIHRMPVTAVLALIGAAAISALPPLNGFVSEWLLFQSLLNGPLLGEWEMKIGTAVVAALLALSAALAAACFVRAYGIAFLGRPRSAEAARAREVEGSRLAAMAVPAALCMGVGVLPTAAILLVEPVNAALLGVTLLDTRQLSWLWLAPESAVGNSYSGLIVFATVAVLSLLAVAGIHRYASDRVRRAPAWDCGYDADPGPVAQYTASSFAQPLRRVFATHVFAAREAVDMPAPGETRPARFALEMRDPVWEGLFVPIGRLVEVLAERIDGIQFLTIRKYLALMFLALVVLLALVAVGQA